MARTYRFTTGRYSPSGERITEKVEKSTKGKLSTMSSLRYGGKSRQKSQQRVEVLTRDGKFRNIYQNKALSKRVALTNATRFANNGKFEDALIELDIEKQEADHLIKSLMAMADRVEAPIEVKAKISKMDPYRAYTVGKVNRLSVEMVFDYGFTLEDEIVDAYVSKWDDLIDFINIYEKAWGPIR